VRALEHRLVPLPLRARLGTALRPLIARLRLEPRALRSRHRKRVRARAHLRPPSVPRVIQLQEHLGARARMVWPRTPQEGAVSGSTASCAQRHVTELSALDISDGIRARLAVHMVAHAGVVKRHALQLPLDLAPVGLPLREGGAKRFNAQMAPHLLCGRRGASEARGGAMHALDSATCAVPEVPHR